MTSYQMKLLETEPHQKRRWLKDKAEIAAGNASNVERFLILFASLVAFWFLLFEIYPPSMTRILGDLNDKNEILGVSFLSVVVVHIAALITHSGRIKIYMCLFHAAFWGMWGLFAATAAAPTMATPLFVGLFVMSFFEAVRIKLKLNDV